MSYQRKHKQKKQQSYQQHQPSHTTQPQFQQLQYELHQPSTTNTKKHKQYPYKTYKWGRDAPYGYFKILQKNRSNI